ncbi:dehydrogenase e1 component domain-containing protein [Ditylenchus destructor]|nr:dehydrogenase e1 component domain-containing protein [Ditylenchus destructor]
MTKNWSLPIVFICENNKYAMYTPVDRGSAYNEFYDRVKFLPGIWADGMDVLAVREALRFARDYAASGYGPIIVELATYNYTGYSTDDPGGDGRRSVFSLRSVSFFILNSSHNENERNGD